MPEGRRLRLLTRAESLSSAALFHGRAISREWSMSTASFQLAFIKCRGRTRRHVKLGRELEHARSLSRLTFVGSWLRPGLESDTSGPGAACAPSMAVELARVPAGWSCVVR
jgi:hypothetical protein